MRVVSLAVSVVLCSILVGAADVKSTVLEIGQYIFTEINQVGLSPQLHIERRNDLKDRPVRIWGTLKDYPFLQLGDATVPRPPILNGNYQLEETTRFLSDKVTVDTIFKDKDEEKVVIYGQLLAPDMELVAHYTMTFEITALKSHQIQFTVDVRPTDDCQTSIQNARTFLTYATDEDENFYGFGESFSHFNLKGRRVPVLVSEQGVGRGEQPITDYLNENVAQGVGGDWYTTYAPKPIYITNHNRTVFLNNSEVSFFDLTATGADGSVAEGKELYSRCCLCFPCSLPRRVVCVWKMLLLFNFRLLHNILELNTFSYTSHLVGSLRVQIEVWSLQLLGYLMHSSTMLGAIEAITELTGRQKVPPAWTQTGAVVGLEGGTANVTSIVDRMYAAGVPMAGELYFSCVHFYASMIV